MSVAHECGAMGFNSGLCNDKAGLTHHTVGVCVTRLTHRETLDHLWCHPGERPHQGHVCGVGHELGGTKITNLGCEENKSQETLHSAHIHFTSP